MSIYSRGTRSCVNCDWAKANAAVQRWFDLHNARWRFYRSCAWCGCCYPATVDEYNKDHPELAHTFPVHEEAS